MSSFTQRSAPSTCNASYEAQGHEQDYCADEGHEDGARQAAERHGDAELTEEEASHEGSHDADDNITNQPVAAAYDGGGQPSSDKTHHSPQQDGLECHEVSLCSL